MPARALDSVRGGAQNAGPRCVFISCTDTAAALKCATALKNKLDYLVDDVRLGAASAQAAGTALLTGGDYDWTDFVALVDDQYVSLNRPDPATHPSGDFALALRTLQRAGSDQRIAWAAMIARVPWRAVKVAQTELVSMRCLRILSNDAAKPVTMPTPPVAAEVRLQLEPHEVFATSPPDRVDKHALAAVTQLLAAAS